jgi:nitrite reductase/ring-hydroxylating ferredoxin subunit
MGNMSDPKHWYELANAPVAGTILGHLNDIADGQVHMVSTPQTFKVLLLRSADSVHAFVNRCAHFGVPLAARQEQLMFKPHQSITCNVHYARFRWTDGACESGECDGVGLLPIPVECDAGGNIRIASTTEEAPRS